MATETSRHIRVLSSELLGPFSRFRLDHVEVTILGSASRWWHVYDAERADEWTGTPELIIQQSTREDALRFLRLRERV